MYEKEILNTLLACKRKMSYDELYREVQISFAYYSCAIDGCSLSYDQVAAVYDSYAVIPGKSNSVDLGDIMTVFNHFALFDHILEYAKGPLDEEDIQKCHAILKRGTLDERRDWFCAGGYKIVPNGFSPDIVVAEPDETQRRMAALLRWYHSLFEVTVADIAEFHYRFEIIHPCQDCNGIIGRMLVFRETIGHELLPAVPDAETSRFYIRALEEYPHNKKELVNEIRRQQTEFGKRYENSVEKRRRSETDLSLFRIQ